MIHIGHLDLNIVEHCNQSCANCSHASPLFAPWFMPVEMVERDLRALQPILKAHAVHIVGGEPLLHPQLADVLRAVRSVGLSISTNLITNGRLLRRIPDEAWKEMQSLSLMMYPGIAGDVLPWAIAKSTQFGVDFSYRAPTEFYGQLAKVPSDGRQFETCHWKSTCYTVHRGYFYLCSQSAFFPRAIMGRPPGTDGLPLAGITEDSLREFMARTQPLETCRVCTAHTMQAHPWRQVSRDDWISTSTP